MRSSVRLASIVGVATLSVIAVAPAMAAAPVAQSGANAITLSVAGNGQGTGDTTATNDGSKETKTGNATPPVSVLKGQTLANLGVLAQEATARANSTSAACAGVAGEGGSVVQIGDSSCLTPGTPIDATLGSLNLSNLIVADPASALAPLNAALTPILTNLAPLTTALNSGLDQVRAQIGNPGIVAGFGAVEGSCTASLGSATGNATLADAAVTVNLPTGAPQSSITLLNLPANPKPNTHLTTDLSDVLDLVLDTVTTDLNTSLNGAGAPLSALTGALKANVVTAIRDQVEKNLAPLEQNVIDVVLNRQIRPTRDSIKVRALDVSVLPAAKAFTGSDLLDLQIGNAACGPSGRVQAAAAAPEQATTAPAAIPTSVSAGYATMPAAYATPGEQGDNHGLVLGAFALLVSLGAGFVTFRRLRG
jgi:hypothetical protein